TPNFIFKHYSPCPSKPTRPCRICLITCPGRYLVSELTLAGFARELSGNEDALTMADPVLEMDGAFFLAPSANWTWSSLSPLFPGEQEYVRWVRRQDRTPIREGQGVWLAGRELLAPVGDMTFLRDFALELGS